MPGVASTISLPKILPLARRIREAKFQALRIKEDRFRDSTGASSAPGAGFVFLCLSLVRTVASVATIRVMSGPLLAKLMLSAVAAVQGLAPLLIDLNSTHATHPQWPGHARFHLVWQTFNTALLAMPEVGLVWWPGAGVRGRFFLAAGLAATSMIGFLLALVLRRFYLGTLHDLNGIPPIRVRTRAGPLEIDGNLLMVIVGLTVLTIAVLVFAL
jgi:hypothetical protein